MSEPVVEAVPKRKSLTFQQCKALGFNQGRQDAQNGITESPLDRDVVMRIKHADSKHLAAYYAGWISGNKF